MEIQKTNIPEQQEDPKLIAAESVSSSEALPPAAKVETLIEVPSKWTKRRLGRKAIDVEQVNTPDGTGEVVVNHLDTVSSTEGGRYNSGIVPLGNSRFNNGIISPEETDQ